MDIIKALKETGAFEEIRKKRGKNVYEITYRENGLALSRDLMLDDNKLYGTEKEIETIKKGRYATYKIHYIKNENEVYSTADEVIKSFQKELRKFKCS
jgi:hypothetical protein